MYSTGCHCLSAPYYIRAAPQATSEASTHNSLYNVGSNTARTGAEHNIYFKRSKAELYSSLHTNGTCFLVRLVKGATTLAKPLTKRL